VGPEPTPLQSALEPPASVTHDHRIGKVTPQEPRTTNVVNRTRALTVTTVASLIVACAALGLVVAIAANPQGWFPGAYAQQGDKGPPGDPGPIGPQGPPGPVGPDAQTAVDDLSARMDDLETRVDDLENETGSSTLVSDVGDLQSSVDDLQSSAETLQSSVDELCIYVPDAGC